MINRFKSFFSKYYKWFFSGILFISITLGSLIGVFNIGYGTAVSGLSIPGLSVDYSGGTWKGNGTTLSGSVSVKSSTGCTGTTYTAQTSTLTLKNTSGDKRLISFDIGSELKAGSLTINGNTPENSFSKVLEANDKVTVTLKSGAAKDEIAQATFSNIKMTAYKDVTLVLKAPANGSYSFNGQKVESDKQITVSNFDSNTIIATPNSGFKVRDIYNQTLDEYISLKSSESSLTFNDSCTITVRFETNKTPIFTVGKKDFIDLTSASNYGVSSDEENIYLMSNGTISSGNYTLKRRLVIPYNDALTYFEENAKIVYKTYSAPTSFRELELASNAHISVENGGKICVASEISSKGQHGGYNGTPTGPDGRIKMNSGSTITFKSGTNLYCYGYIYGDGLIECENGSTVYECFQIKDWKGGSITSSIYGYTFIVSQYYVQNIECTLKMNTGATEKLVTALNASSKAYTMGATFIGSGGLFNISTGYLTKKYDSTTDRLIVDLHGNAIIQPFTLTNVPALGSVSTGGYELPITNNITINIHNGTTYIGGSSKQDVKLLPGCKLAIDENAYLKFKKGSRLYVYDESDYGNFAGKAKLYVIGYSVANGTKAIRNANSIVDVIVDVNGTIDCNGEGSDTGGYLYTTDGGASIISSNKTGKVLFSNKSYTSQNAIYEAEDETKIKVNVVKAKLTNGISADSKCVPGATTNKYFYDSASNKWFNSYTVTYDSNGGSGSIQNISNNLDASDHFIVSNGNSLLKEDYTFNGWSTNKNSSQPDAIYSVGANVLVSQESLILYAVWKKTNHKITYHGNGGTLKNNASSTADTYQKVKITNETNNSGIASLNANPYNSPNPIKKFRGWATTQNGSVTYSDQQSNVVVNSDLELWAVWTQYIFEIKYFDGDTLLSTQQNVIENTITQLNDPAPVKDHFKLLGWSKEKNKTEDSFDTNSEEDFDIGGNISVTNNTSLYAVWQKVEFIIRYDGNGADNSSAMNNISLTIRKGEIGYLNTCLYEKTNYMFLGWAETSSGSVKYEDEGAVSPTKDLVLYAKREEAREFTIRFVDDVTQQDIFSAKVVNYNGDLVLYNNSDIETYGGLNNNAYSIKKRIDSDGKVYFPGETVSKIRKNHIFTAFRGGWYQEKPIRGVVQPVYYIERSAYDFEVGKVKGLYSCELKPNIIDMINSSRNPSSTKRTYYFDGQGRLSTETLTVQYFDSKYMIENGQIVTIENEGLKKVVHYDNNNVLSIKYYYVFTDGKVIYDKANYYVSSNKTNGLLCEGRYNFLSDGSIEISDNSTNKFSADSEIPYQDGEYAYINGVKVAYGLFKEDGYIYYAKNNGEIAKNESYYVNSNKLNNVCFEDGTPVTAGTHYFDENGRLIK